MEKRQSQAEKLKSLVAGRRPFGKRLLLALLPAFSVSFTVFFFGPLDLICGNRQNVSYSALQVLPSCAVITAAVLTLLLLAASVPGGKVHAFLVSLYTGAALAFYIQGAFLNPDLGTMDGHAVNWPGFSTKMTANLAAWFVVLLIPHLIHYFSNRSWRVFVMILSAALILMQGFSLGIKLYEQAGIDSAASKKYYLSAENMMKTAQKNNIAVFLLDTVSNDDLDAMLEKYPGALDLFHDFTRYDNAGTHYMFTVPSLVDLLTGQEWDAENVHTADYMNGAWSSEEGASFYAKLASEGYERNIYMLLPEAAKDPAVLKDAFSNLKLSDRDYEIDKQAMVKLVKLSFYRYFPLTMKPFFMIYTSDINNLVKLPDAWDNEWELVSRMSDTPFTKGSAENAFYFYYLLGSHLPYRMDERGRLISSDLAPEFNVNYSEMEDQLAGFFYLISEYIRQLKEMDLYEQAGIIILADHGSNRDPKADHQPIYLVKMPGEKHGEMETRSVQITTQDCFRADVLAMAGYEGTQWGVPSNAFPEGDEERWTRAFGKDDRFPALSGSKYNVMREYRYVGDGDLLREKWTSGDYETIPMIDSYY